MAPVLLSNMITFQGEEMADNINEGHLIPELEGRYADRFRIGYRSCVFILDFEQSFMSEKNEHVHTRIITSPEDIKAFMELLQKSIGQYEQSHGTISVKDKTTRESMDNTSLLSFTE